MFKNTKNKIYYKDGTYIRLSKFSKSDRNRDRIRHVRDGCILARDKKVFMVPKIAIDSSLTNKDRECAKQLELILSIAYKTEEPVNNLTYLLKYLGGV